MGVLCSTSLTRPETERMARLDEARCGAVPIKSRIEKAINKSKPPWRFRRDRLAMAEVSASSPAGRLAGEWARLDDAGWASFTPQDFILAVRPRSREAFQPGSDGIGSRSPPRLLRLRSSRPWLEPAISAAAVRVSASLSARLCARDPSRR